MRNLVVAGFASILLVPILLPCAVAPVNAQEKKPMLRAGMIGLDTSHVTAFTKILNDPRRADEFGVRVVVGYPGGSHDIPESKDRLEKFTAELKEKYGVEIVDSVEELVKKCDVVFLESVDGRPHLKQLMPVLKAGKPVFVDKPMGGSLLDVLLMFHHARTLKVPIFSSSSLRFSPLTHNVKKNLKIGDVLGCMTHGPCPIEKHHPDLFWYGIHGVEPLFTIMGPGCKTVTRTHTEGTDVVTGVWQDGRVGTYRGIRDGKKDYGSLVFGSKGIESSSGSGGYEPLLAEICKFFKSGVPPVSAEETIEIFAFMEAADESKRREGAPVAIESVMKRASTEMDRTLAR